MESAISVLGIHNAIPQFPICGPGLLASLRRAIPEVYQEPCKDCMISLGNDKRKETSVVAQESHGEGLVD
jgi:hypothetical protein